MVNLMEFSEYYESVVAYSEGLNALMNQQLKPGDLKKHYEPGMNKGNIAYETFCKHIERWLQNGTLKIGNKQYCTYLLNGLVLKFTVRSSKAMAFGV